MVLKLDDYLIRGFKNTLYVPESDSTNRYEELPESILQKMGVDVARIVISAPTTYHLHKRTKEVFVFQKDGTLMFEGIEVKVNKGDVLFVPEGMRHQLMPQNYREEKEKFGYSYSTLEALRITVPFFDPKDEFAAKF